VYPRESVARFVTDNFVPVRVHVKEQPAMFDRFGARWTPTILVLDSEGNERHRIEGFLPEKDFLGQLALALGHVAFAEQRWTDAERWLAEALERNPDGEAAPEALYWKGVSRYKATGDPKELNETAKAFANRYVGSSWAKKASVWAA